MRRKCAVVWPAWRYLGLVLSACGSSGTGSSTGGGTPVKGGTLNHARHR